MNVTLRMLLFNCASRGLKCLDPHAIQNEMDFMASFCNILYVLYLSEKKNRIACTHALGNQNNSI